MVPGTDNQQHLKAIPIIQSQKPSFNDPFDSKTTQSRQPHGILTTTVLENH